MSLDDHTGVCIRVNSNIHDGRSVDVILTSEHPSDLLAIVGVVTLSGS